MSKIVCDICGTTYDESAGVCPVCGWSQDSELPSDTVDLDTDFLDDVRLDEPATVPAAPPVSQAPKGKVSIDYDAVGGKKRTPPKVTPPQTKDDDDDDDDEEESGSNAFLVVILVLLILALLAVSAYIGWTKILKPRMGGDGNKPQETISALPLDTPTEEPPRTAVDVDVETEPTIPCTGLNMVGSMDTLTYAGQYWRLMVKATPDNTTDKVVYTSGDESIVTIDEYGRVTAVGEGETTITVTCGSEQITTTAVVSYKTEETTAAAVTPTTPAAPSAGSTGASVTPVAPGTTLSLKKSDITFFRIGTYFTLEIEGGIAAEDVDWSTSDSSIANVYNGKVTALGRGVAVITAEYKGQTAQCVVRVKP